MQAGQGSGGREAPGPAGHRLIYSYRITHLQITENEIHAARYRQPDELYG